MPPSLTQLYAVRDRWLRRPALAAYTVGAAAVAIGVAYLARIGTSEARVGGAVVIACLAAVGMLLWLRSRRQPTAVETTRSLIDPVDRELGQKLRGAIDLATTVDRNPKRGSVELAEYHLQRLTERIPAKAVESRVARAALVLSGVSVVIAIATSAIMLHDPVALVEGYDVLFASGGTAPFGIQYLDASGVSATPPAYLPRASALALGDDTPRVPKGTVITVRGRRRHPGRTLVLRAGTTEVPFQRDNEVGTDDDEAEQVVARITLVQDSDITVAAKFGDVRITEPGPLSVFVDDDLAPTVTIDGAPRTYRLLDTPRISLRWNAIDDHGIREVQLVLRAGQREERRALSKPNNTQDRGSIDLSADDAFFADSHLPVRVTVEALDNDTVDGPKWGRSAAVVVFPPQVGERQANRLADLIAARNQIADLLAVQVEHASVGAPSQPTAIKRSIANERDLRRRAIAALGTALDGNYGGLRLAARFRSLTQAQRERLAEQTVAMARPKRREKTETALLIVAATISSLGYRDTQAAAIELAKVADDLAEAILEGGEADAVFSAQLRIDADRQVLAEGGRSLVRLGTLGRDLGEIVENGLRRIDRPAKSNDRFHASLAAEDLAARLRNPLPSFGGGGGGGDGSGEGKGEGSGQGNGQGSGSGQGHDHGGVEAGGSAGEGGEPATKAPEEAKALEDALRQLRMEHAGEMNALDQAVDEAMSSEERQGLRDTLKEEAKALRDAAKGLPKEALDPTSGEAEAARARSGMESMAGSLERGQVAPALKAGKQALKALDKAGQAASSPPTGEARRALEKALEAAEAAQRDVARKTAEKLTERLKEAARREDEIAKKAQEVLRKSDTSEAPIPGGRRAKLQRAIQAMKRAAERLRGKDPTGGRASQKQAQRLLEMSQGDAEGDQPSRRNDRPAGDGKSYSQDVDVPGGSRNESADAFRRRASKGLGLLPPRHLRDALRRYTEGLLR